MRPRSSTKALQAPSLDPITLDTLAPGLDGDLESGGIAEGLDFQGLDLSGRDLGGIDISQCRFTDIDAHETLLRGATLRESTVTGLNAPVLSAARLRLRDVELSRSRIGSAELYDSDWRSVAVRDCKLGFVNLRGSVIQDLLVTDCAIDELDLGGARVTRLAFERCTLGTLEITGTAFLHADLRGAEFSRIGGIEGLRGATLDEHQFALLLPLLADTLGVRIAG